MTLSFFRRALPRFAVALCAVLLLEASRALSGSHFSAAALLERALFAGAVLMAAGAGRPARLPDGRWRWSRAGLAVAAAGVLAAMAASLWESVAAAWIAIAVWFAVTLAAASVPALPRRRAAKSALVLSLAAAAGAVPMAAVELESRFAHEEIFVLLQAILLGAVWLSLLLAATSLPSSPETAAPRGVPVSPRALGVCALLLAAAGLTIATAAYQESFSPKDPPSYPGISPRSPFLCGEGRADIQTFDTREVFAALLARVAANPRKTPPEEGMLALSTGDAMRAEAFRAGLLREVAGREFSERGETKYWQYEASLRAYYYPRVRAAFSRLFSPEEKRRVEEWFAAINRRALSPGLDDAIYALAFGKRPEGPYENQENGAGLLALLETGRLAAPDLSERNRRYLDRVPRGWQARFRNNDDSYGYQPEWINNAFFQSLRSGRAPEEAIRHSFEWLLLQAQPDGLPPDYNAAVPPLLPGTAYLGATLLHDPALLWLSGRSVRGFARQELSLPAQPGVERAVDLEGRSPSAGSCLLFADSGLPNRVGPLAPDKIVFRDGWTPESAYLLLNLRFAGWHRYRATNAVVMLRRGEVLAEEKRGEPFAWLPLERRIFRDKRVPREYVNGLLVEPTGFAAAIGRLTGFGGHWAQDPPHFARVEEFRTGADADRSTTAVSGWRGWSHRRRVFFRRDGPIVIVDEADGPPGRASALAWHVRGWPEPGAMRFRLGDASRADLALLPLEEGGGTVEIRTGPGSARLDLLYRPARKGRLRLASVFLTGRWSTARAEVRREGDRAILEVSREGEHLSLPLR